MFIQFVVYNQKKICKSINKQSPGMPRIPTIKQEIALIPICMFKGKRFIIARIAAPNTLFINNFNIRLKGVKNIFAVTKRISNPSM